MDAEILKELMSEFISETSDSLDSLEKDLLSYESGESDSDTINRIFRNIHTVKGSGGSLALHNIEKLSHEGEQLLDRIRTDGLHVDPSIVSVLLELVDALRSHLVSLQDHECELSENHEELQKKLRDKLAQIESAIHESEQSLLDEAGTDVESQINPVDSEEITEESDVSDTNEYEQDPNVDIIPPNGKNGEDAFWGLFIDEPGETQQESNLAAATESSEVKSTEERSGPPSNSSAVAEKESNAQQAISETSIRVEIKQLDNLMALVGELVLTRNQLLQKLESIYVDNVDQSLLHLDHITSELQQGMMKTRMQPIGNAWTKLPRIVRDLAKSLGKNVYLEMDGKDTELDRSLIEAIKDPLLHLVRNSVDHGIELPEDREQAGKDRRGMVFLSAYHESGQVNIDISDDGRGLDLDKIRRKALEKGILSQEQVLSLSDREVSRLIFHPGFSTADQISNISGRGVGMDVVRSNIEKIGGSIDINSEWGHGTNIKIKIPLTLAIIPALLVGSTGERYAIPQLSLQELVRLEGDEISEKVETLYDSRVYRMRGEIIPLVFLNEVLKTGKGDQDLANLDELNIVVLQSDGQPYGLVVDHIFDSEEIVVKPFSKQLKKMSCYSGATIMGDGRVALILDAQGIGSLSNALNSQREELAVESDDAESGINQNTTTMLVFNVGSDARMAVPLVDVNRIEEIEPERLERIRGELIVQHRGKILKLLDLSKFVPGINQSYSNAEETLTIIVFTRGDRSVGLLVSEVVDIVDEVIEIQESSVLDCIVGALPLAKKVTEILDVERLMDLSDPLMIPQKNATYE